MLHALIHMDQHAHALTSETLAAMLETSPAVVRRTMAGLRDRGIVGSEKGRGGGWRLARPLDRITVLDIYEALGEPTLFALGPSRERPECLVERAVDERLGEALLEAAATLRERLAATRLDAIRRDFEARAAAGTAGTSKRIAAAKRRRGA